MNEGQNLKNIKEPFAFIEKKLIFGISRDFFRGLCMLAGLALVLSIVSLIYNIIPPIREKIIQPPLPAEISIDLSEIEKIMIPPVSTATKIEPSKAVPIVKKEEKPEVDTLQITVDAYLDTLKSLFPQEKYTWKSAYRKVAVDWDWWGNPIEYKRIAEIKGIDRYVYSVLELYSDKSKKVDVLKEMIKIIGQVPVDKRGKIIDIYADLRQKKERERQSEIKKIKRKFEEQQYSAESKYLREKRKKETRTKLSLMIFGGAFICIAISGLFLCLLAIERNTRLLQKFIEKEHVNNK